MPNYTALAATAKRLIEANGRNVTFRRLRRQVDDPTKPWRASPDVRNPSEVEIQAKTVFVDPVSAAKMGLAISAEELIAKIDAVGLTAADSVPWDLETFDEIVDQNSVLRIEHTEVLRPGTKKLLYIFLLVSTALTPTVENPCGAVPSSLTWTQNGLNGVATWVSAFNPISWSVQLIDNANNPVINTSLAGSERSMTIFTVPTGTWRIRLRDTQSQTTCWVTSAPVVFP